MPLPGSPQPIGQAQRGLAEKLDKQRGHALAQTRLLEALLAGCMPTAVKRVLGGGSTSSNSSLVGSRWRPRHPRQAA